MKLGVFGPQGSGKTTIAMLFARMLTKDNPDVKIYTNINATGENLITISDLADLPFQDNKPKVFILDEAMFSIDSRNSNSKQNKVWTKALALFRKSDVVLAIFVTHTPSMLDIRIRDQLDYIIMARKNPTHFDYLLYEVISKISIPLQMARTKNVFNFANFDTKDFPDPITTERLELLPIFKILK
jgi:ABC-type dipeptide/oligopeptide/nickel transport system ATPase subunit